MQIGRYELLGEIARGGMGVVYRGRAPDGTIVALKLLLAGKEASPSQRRRVDTEALALLRVRHPHVVSLLDAGEHDGVPYLVMEWIEGETLAERLKRGPLEPAAAAELVRRLAEGLAHCHAQGVLHRDLKPGNVLLRARDGAPLLTDFGLSKDTDASSSVHTADGSALGTPGYWPPEQARGEVAEIGPRSDVYGLGALLHAALTGAPPHEGRTISELLVATVRPPQPPSMKRPGIPRWLDALCLRALATDPAERPASAEALARELAAGPASRSRRGPVVLALVALGCGVAALAATLPGAAEPLPPAPAPAPPEPAAPPPPNEPASPAPDPRGAAIREQLLAGVESLELVGGPSFEPGLVCAVGEAAWPLLGAGAEVWAAVALHGRGRVLVLGHSAFLHPEVLRSRPGVTRLLENATRWAAGGAPPRKVGTIASWRWSEPPARPPGFVPPGEVSTLREDLALLAGFQARGYEVSYAVEDSPELGGLDLVVWTEAHLSEPALERVEALVRGGGGLIVAVSAWQLQAALGELPLRELSWQRLLARVGLLLAPAGRVTLMAGQERLPVGPSPGEHAGRVLAALQRDPARPLEPAGRQALVLALRSAPRGHALLAGAAGLAADPRTPIELARELAIAAER